MKKRIALIMLIVLVVYLAFTCIFNIVIYCSATLEKNRSDELKNVDYIVVLGNKLNDNSPSAALLKRLEKTVILANKYNDAKIIVSGGVSKGNTKSEAMVMKDYLVSRGVREDRIIIEDESKNTRENMKNVKNLIGNDSTVLVVTNSFHLLRSISIAKEYKLGEVYGCPVENGSVSTTVQYFFLEPLFVVANFFISLFN